MNLFQADTKTALEAKCEAQRIAFAPVIFQASRILRDRGILERLRNAGTQGMTLAEMVPQCDLPRYGVKVLLEAGLGIGLVCLKENRYTLSKVGYFVLRDPMTRVNMDVVHHMWYRAFAHLEESLLNGRPEGLKTLGNWDRLYEGLSSLPPAIRDSWFTFDHFYSDAAFPATLPLVFAHPVQRLLDVGGNTGKWAVQCARFNPGVRVTIADIPEQLALADKTLEQEGLKDRIDLVPVDILKASAVLPGGHDVIWMSQFLDCFSEEEIVSILKRAADVMDASTQLYILDLFWDRQPNETAAFCLQQTSLYFSCIANGNSQMYHSNDMIRCLREAGLKVVEEKDEVGLYHTLLRCRKA